MSAEKKGDEYRAGGRHRNAAGERQTESKREREREKNAAQDRKKQATMKEGGQMQHMGGDKQVQQKEGVFFCQTVAGRQTVNVNDQTQT